jgi:hypothetical protein
MNNVVSIGSRKPANTGVKEPSDRVPEYLRQSMVEEGYEVNTGFTKTWDAKAKLWRLKATVQKTGKAARDMVFWYRGDFPCLALDIPEGGAICHHQATQVLG